MSSRNANRRSDGRSRFLTAHEVQCKPRENSNGMSASLCSPPTPWVMSWLSSQKLSDEGHHRTSTFDIHKTPHHGAARNEVKRANAVHQSGKAPWPSGRHFPTAGLTCASPVFGQNHPPHISCGFLQCHHLANSDDLQHSSGMSAQANLSHTR